MTTSTTITPPSPKPAEHVCARVASSMGKMSMLPSAAAQALELAKDPNCSVAQFSEIVQRDVKLATDIISLANSPLIASSRPMANLYEAVVLLGFRRCRNLIISSSVASLMERVPLKQQWMLELLTEHSFLTAIAATHINRSLAIGFQGEEFTAGLVHDMGRVVMASAFDASFAQADPLSFDEDASVLTQERSVTGTDHCELGAWLLGQNHFPKPLSEVVRFHHTPDVDCSEQKLVALTAAADHVANHLQREQSEEGYDPSTNHGLRVLNETAVRHANDRFAEMAPTVLRAVIADASETCRNRRRSP